MSSVLLFLHATLIAISFVMGLNSSFVHVIGKAKYTRWNTLDEVFVASALNDCLDALSVSYSIGQCSSTYSSVTSKKEIIRGCQLEEDDPFLDYFLETGEITGTLLDSFMNETAAAEHIMSAKRIIVINNQCDLNETTIRTEEQETVESNLFEANDDASVLYMFSDDRWIPVEDCTRTPTEKIYTCRERSRPIPLHSRKVFDKGILRSYIPAELIIVASLIVLCIVAVVICKIRQNLSNYIKKKSGDTKSDCSQEPLV